MVVTPHSACKISNNKAADLSQRFIIALHFASRQKWYFLHVVLFTIVLRTPPVYLFTAYMSMHRGGKMPPDLKTSGKLCIQNTIKNYFPPTAPAGPPKISGFPSSPSIDPMHMYVVC
jgi:hypothetical protein